MRQITRKWNFGDVYSPHDLSPSEMTKWKKNTGRKQDLVDLLGVRPLDMYRVSFFVLDKKYLVGITRKIGSGAFCRSNHLTTMPKSMSEAGGFRETYDERRSFWL